MDLIEIQNYMQQVIDNARKLECSSKEKVDYSQDNVLKQLIPQVQPYYTEMFDRFKDFDHDNYILGDYIGRGSFGKVYQVRDKSNGATYAVKISLKTIEDDSEENISDLSREINIISKLHHNAVLQFIDYSPTNFKKKPKPMIITEFTPNGSLENLLSPTSKIEFNSTRKLIIIYGIASAMKFLHSYEIIHRDLKPANILIDENLYPKIADFGLSKFNYKTPEDFQQSMEGSIKGTPIYMSPEIWENGEYSKASDVYAFALIVYQIITNEKIFDNMCLFRIIIEIKNGNRPEIKPDVPQCWKKLIEKCWSNEPKDRTSFDEIVEQLKNDSDFITESVNKEEYLNYVKYIDESKTSYNKIKSIDVNGSKLTPLTLSDLQYIFEHLVYLKFSPFEEYEIQDYLDIDLSITLCPFDILLGLNNDCKILVKEAENDPQKQFEIAKNFIEGKNNFPFNPQVGIVYLKNSININGYLDSAIYYVKMLIKGNIIPKNHSKAKKLINKYIQNSKENIFLLTAKLLKNEKNYSEAKIFYEKLIQEGNSDAMYNYGRLIIDGKISYIDKEEGIKYLQKAVSKNHIKAMHKYGLILLDEEDSTKKEEGLKYIKESADSGYAKAMYHYYKILIEKKDDKSANNYLKKAAYKGHREAMFEYGLVLDKSENPNIQREVLNLFQKSGDKGNVESIFNYGLLMRKIHNKFIVFNSINIYSPSLAKDIARLLYYSQESFRIIRAAANAGSVNAMLEHAEDLFTKSALTEDENSEARMYFKMAADHGNVEAMRLYANILAKSKNPVVLQEAFKYVKMAAEKGDIESIGNYAYSLYQGQGVKKNDVMALEQFKIAADKGNAESAYYYASMKRNGEGGSVNKREAKKYFKKSADAGFVWSMEEYAYMVDKGDGCLENNDEALIYYKKAIDSNKACPKTMYDYASLLMYLKRSDESMKYLKKSADSGYLDAIKTYASLRREGKRCFGDKREALKYFKIAADKGETDEMVEYAEMLYTGDGVEVNKEEALKYYKMAAKKHNLKARNFLSQMEGNNNDDGDGDGEKSILKTLANKGSIKAMKHYASMKRKGDNCQIDKEEALKYYKMAADKGDVDSMQTYAYMVHEGEGGPVNKEETLKYLKMAADKGNDVAMNSYAYLVENGDGCEANIEEAKIYYQKSIDQGNKDAMYNYAKILMKENKKEEAMKYIKMSNGDK